jgi:hypothetical protein
MQMTNELITAIANTVGLIAGLIGAWFVGWEVVQKFQGKKYKMDAIETDAMGLATNIPDSDEFKAWECGKYRKMKIGLGFLTFGFIVQLAATWVAYCHT